MRRNQIASVLFFVCLIAASLISGCGEPIKVACVGDGITWGWKIVDPNENSYPAVLQKILGPQYTVKNFGIRNLTLCKQGNDPYWNHVLFSESTEFKPDIAVIMLGSNDAKPINWPYESDFIFDYLDLIKHYRALGARVYIASPPPVYGVGRHHT
jgi:lysophospholipase L1-like esterase